MRSFHLLIAAFAVFQILRYRRSALAFLSPTERAGEGRRPHLVGFLVTVLALVLLTSSLLLLLRTPAPR